jgi:hypothetical protein
MSDTTPALTSQGRIPPLRQAATQIWIDTWHVLSLLSNLFLIAATINIVGDVITFMASQDRPEDAGDSVAIMLLIGAVQALLLTPYMIAVHRLVVLGEIAPSYGVNFGNPRFMRFYAWSLALAVCFAVPLVIGRNISTDTDAGGWVSAAIGFALLLFSLRIVILFPAIAVDAPGAGLGNVLADTKGHAVRILLLGLLVIAPIVIALIVLGTIFGLLVGFEERDTITTTVAGSIVEAVSLTALIVMASRIYGWIGNRVTHT